MGAIPAARVVAATLAAACAVLAACGGRERCAGSASCPPGTGCDPSGACAPLALRPGERSARLLRLAPTDWAVTRADRPGRAIPATDVLELGGGGSATLHLAFGPVPDAVGRALLVLSPHPSWSGPPGAGEVVVHRTPPFRSAGLSRRRAPAPFDSPAAIRRLEPGRPRPLVIDLTRAVVELGRHRDRRLFLVLRARPAGGALRLASPHATDPDLRPRLDLLVR